MIKLEDPPTPVKLTQIRRLLAGRVQIFGGLGGAFFIEELGRGADGTMTGFAFSEVLVAIYTRFKEGNATQARAIFERYLPLIRYEAQPGVGLAIRKELLRRRGGHAHRRAPRAGTDARCGDAGRTRDDPLRRRPERPGSRCGQLNRRAPAR